MDIKLEAIFTFGQESISVPGFYDGNGTYRIRFSPENLVNGAIKPKAIRMNFLVKKEVSVLCSGHRK
jgi:hypothetical protein